jgi:hypothetical protein
LKVNQLQGHWNGRRSGRFGLISLNVRVFEEHIVVPKIAMENASHWTATFYRVDKNNLGQTFINQLCKPFCKLVAKKRKTGSKMIKSIEKTLTSGRLTSCANSIIFLEKSLAIWTALTS